MVQPATITSSDRTIAIHRLGLRPLMARDRVVSEVLVGIVDGAVDYQHPALAGVDVRVLGERCRAGGRLASHATFIAGVIAADAGSAAPGICPHARLVNCAVAAAPNDSPADLQAESLLTALETCLGSGCRIVNLSVELVRPSRQFERRFDEAMAYAASRGVLVVRATSNDATTSEGLGRQHSWPIPVTSCGPDGRPADRTRLGLSVGRHGVGGPGWSTLGLDVDGGYQHLRGTSVATAYVSAALALLWSLYPRRSAEDLRRAVGGVSTRGRRTIPTLLNVSDVITELERR